MRKFLIGAALAASALTAAAPAAAQYYPQPQNYGYNNGYANNGYGQTRSLMVRVDNLRQRIRILDQRNLLSERDAYRMDAEAQQLRNRIRQQSYRGINPNERYDIERRLARLEQRVQYPNGGGRGQGFVPQGYGQYQNGYGQYQNGYGQYQNGYGQNGYNQYSNGQYQNGYVQSRDGRWQDQNGTWHDRNDGDDRDDRDRDRD